MQILPSGLKHTRICEVKRWKKAEERERKTKLNLPQRRHQRVLPGHLPCEGVSSALFCFQVFRRHWEDTPPQEQYSLKVMTDKTQDLQFIQHALAQNPKWFSLKPFLFTRNIFESTTAGLLSPSSSNKCTTGSLTI